MRVLFLFGLLLLLGCSDSKSNKECTEARIAVAHTAEKHNQATTQKEAWLAAAIEAAKWQKQACGSK